MNPKSELTVKYQEVFVPLYLVINRHGSQIDRHERRWTPLRFCSMQQCDEQIDGH